MVLRTVIATLALCVLLSPPSASGEEEPTPTPAPEPVVHKPDPAPAPYYGEVLLPNARNAPEGWELMDEASAASGAPTDEDLRGLAQDLDIEANRFYVQFQSYEKGSKVVTTAMIDVDEQVYAFKAALAAKAAEKRWSACDLGHPGRILVLVGPADGVAELQKKLYEHTIYALGDIAMNRLRGEGGREQAGRAAAVEFTRYIDALAANAGVAMAVRGAAHFLEGQPTKQGEQPNRQEHEKAVDLFTASIADGAAFPPRKSLRVWVAGMAGELLLNWKEALRLGQATSALEDAVKHERDARLMRQRWGNRYNLACAYLRADRKDDALAQLAKGLEVLGDMPISDWRRHYEHMSTDEDMRRLRDDPRFAKLLSRFKPPEPAGASKPAGDAKPDKPEPDKPAK